MTFGPLKAMARLMWPPVKLSLTPLLYVKTKVRKTLSTPNRNLRMGKPLEEMAQILGFTTEGAVCIKGPSQGHSGPKSTVPAQGQELCLPHYPHPTPTPPPPAFSPAAPCNWVAWVLAAVMLWGSY